MNSKDNNSVSLIRTDTFFYKIKKTFLGLFKFKKIKTEPELVEEQDKKVEKFGFFQEIQDQVQKKDKIEELFELISLNKVKIENVSEEQKKELLDFLNKKIDKEKEELDNLKNKILYNKFKNTDNKQSVLERISKKDKSKFLNFLNQEISTETLKLNDLKFKLEVSSNN